MWTKIAWLQSQYFLHDFTKSPSLTRLPQPNQTSFNPDYHIVSSYCELSFDSVLYLYSSAVCVCI